MVWGFTWRLLVGVVLLGGQAAISPSAFAAAAQISVSGLRGGSSIDLGDMDGLRPTTHEEVTIRISNTSGTQYRMFQLLSGRLINEQGAVLEDSAVMVEVRGGNSGTVRFRASTPLSGATVELFTSNGSGTPETLTAIYSLSGTELPAAGTYVGAITYTLQTVDGSAVDSQTLPIRLRVQAIASLSPAEDSFDRVSFGSLEPGKTAPPRRLSLALASNTPGPIQVSQFMDAPLVNEGGEELPLSAVHISASVAGTVSLDSALEPRMRLVANDHGAKSIRRLDLLYTVIIPEDQPAGFYRGILRFAFAAAAGMGGAESLTFQCPIEVEVLPVLSLSMQPAAGGALELTFTGLTPGQTSPPQALLIEVKTNTRRAYEVSQELAHRLVSDEGHQLPEEAFICETTGAARGQFRMAHSTRVPVGKSSLYQSDERGAPTKFSLSCYVKISPDTTAGTYRSSLLFTVTSF